MNLFERIVDSVYRITLAVVIIVAIISTFYFSFKTVESVYNRLDVNEMSLQAQYEAVNNIAASQNIIFQAFALKADDLYNNQVTILKALDQYAEHQASVDKNLNAEISGLQRRATYKYLKSVSVYIFQLESEEEDTRHGAVGSGTIVADRDGYFYILTNKHVCNKDNADNCYVVMGDSKADWVKLSFFKQTESDYDLALWRTNVRLKDKQAMRGLAIAYPQEKIFSVGQYLANKYIYTEGTMAGYEENSALFNMPCAPGCSGSGIFNAEGKMVAVLYAGNVVELSGIPIGGSMDTSKALAINGDVVKLFLKDLF